MDLDRGRAVFEVIGLFDETQQPVQLLRRKGGGSSASHIDRDRAAPTARFLHLLLFGT